MLPMICEVAEFEAARTLIMRELQRAAQLRQKLPEKLRLGAMVEVPSLIFELPQILQSADFVSVGTNDLLQFLFAADRTNPIVSKRYDTLSPAVLNLVRMITATGAEKGKLADVSFCGEIAGRPLEAMALVGLGITSLSMQASSIGPVKMMIRNIDTRQLKPAVEKFAAGSMRSARSDLADFAAAHGVPIGRMN